MRFQENVYFDDSGAAIIKTYRSTAAERKDYYFEHHHTECEICLCVKGSGIYAVGDKRYWQTSTSSPLISIMKISKLTFTECVTFTPKS